MNTISNSGKFYLTLLQKICNKRVQHKIKKCQGAPKNREVIEIKVLLNLYFISCTCTAPNSY